MIDAIWVWLAWRLPRRLVYWCAIRVATHEPHDLTIDEFAAWEFVPNRRFSDGLKLWDRP